MGKYVLAIDQGTTGSTLLLLDREGTIRAQADREFRQIYPQPGWVEHDPEEIWSVTLGLVEPLLAQAKATPLDVAAIGITNQRETTVVWEKETGRPIASAIVWQCRRTAPDCERLRAAGHERVIREKTGLVLDAYFSGTKVAWLLDRIPGARKKAEAGSLAFGTIDSWLLFNLTGGRVHATDPTNASRTMLYDIRERRWDPELSRILGVPERVLPEVRRSSGVFGETDPRAAGGIRAPVAGIAGDQQAALYGQACFEPGMVKNTYGTGCFLLLYTGSRDVRSKGGLLTTVCCDASGGPAYALEGSVFIAGAAVQWLRDGLGLIKTAAETEALARGVESTGGVYFVPAFVGLGAPHWDMDARGAILGLTRGTGVKELVRATLEAMAYQTKDVVDVMASDSGEPLREIRVDGGGCQNDFLMQFQADLLGVRVDRPERIETTALGAGYLAGLGAGFWKDPAEIARLRRTQKAFSPAMPPDVARKLHDGWRAAVERVRTRR
ncbi:MAG: glycerol kinase GlpK [Planctomycetes bacterium]|nr:glycerol kinase GlpK [Planctomycetota bacterium]